MVVRRSTGSTGSSGNVKKELDPDINSNMEVDTVKKLEPVLIKLSPQPMPKRKLEETNYSLKRQQRQKRRKSADSTAGNNNKLDEDVVKGTSQWSSMGKTRGRHLC